MVQDGRAAAGDGGLEGSLRHSVEAVRRCREAGTRAQRLRADLTTQHPVHSALRQQHAEAARAVARLRR